MTIRSRLTAPLNVAARRLNAGISLIYSLLALVAISMAAVALVRSVTGGGLVIGNLAFKQDATSASAIAAETAVAWLTANAATLQNDNAGAGFYATTRQALDLTGANVTNAARAVVDWNNDGCGTSSYPAGSFASCVAASPGTVNVGNGNASRYVILRQCNQEGNPAAGVIDCVRPVTASSQQDTNMSALDYNRSARLSAPLTLQQYYRVIVRTQGARNTVAFTETLIQF